MSGYMTFVLRSYRAHLLNQWPLYIWFYNAHYSDSTTTTPIPPSRSFAVASGYYWITYNYTQLYITFIMNNILDMIYHFHFPLLWECSSLRSVERSSLTPALITDARCLNLKYTTMMYVTPESPDARLRCVVHARGADWHWTSSRFFVVTPIRGRIGAG